MTKTLLTLAHWLAGSFENQAQAQEQPIWFVHLRLWHRPLPHRLQGHLALFAEQANVLYLDQPYRQRIFLLQEASPDQIQVQYLAFKHPDQYRGAATHPERLAAIAPTELEELPGCKLTVTHEDGIFKAQPEPGCRCYFQYEGKTRQVVLGFEVSAGQFRSYDRGVDPETGQALWGALMGPYEFSRCQDFAAELPLNPAPAAP
jgi:hypothetical protein